MLSKLLKYDLKYMLKNMIIFYILAIFFAILTRILFNINNSVILNIITNISVACLFSMLASILINTMMRSWVRFRDSIYKDESYLTHTLPVTKNDIYDSKFFQTLIFFIISFTVILLSLFIAYYTKDNWINLKNMVNSISQGLNFNTTFFVISIILIIFLEVFNEIQCGFLGTILGYKKNNNKLGFSVLFGFIAYLLSQSIVLLLVYVVGLFDSSIMDLFKNKVLLNPESFKLLVLVSIIIYIVIIVLMNLLCKRNLKKGVNII